MKKVIEWLKGNPISAASAVLGLLFLVVTVYFMVIAAGSLTGRVVEENKSTHSQQNELNSKTVELPNPDPNGAPIEFTGVVINPWVIEVVNEVNLGQVEEASQIRQRAAGTNRRNHINAMLGDGDLFPESNSPRIFTEATKDYRDSFAALFTQGDAPVRGYEHLQMPMLRAGMPPSGEEIGEAMSRTVLDFLESVGATSASDLTQEQAELLFKKQQKALLDLLAARAGEIDIYAPVFMPVIFDDDGNIVEQEDAGLLPEGYPFEIAPWAYETAGTPDLDQFWEGQVQLWIVRDLMTVIDRINHSVAYDDQGAVIADDNGDPIRQASNVIDSPVKRLHHLHIVPGYIGLHASGGVDSSSAQTSGGSGGRSLGGDLGRSPGGRTSTPMGPGGPGGPGGLGGLQEPGRGGSQPGGSTGAVAEDQGEPDSEVYGAPSIDILLPVGEKSHDSFFFSPSGRQSNSVYDVRHVRFSIDIEWQALPEFFEHLNHVNAMTVIKMDVTNIDEFDELSNGFVYGSKDVVRIDMVIETIWYRSWTVEFMPDIVRRALAVPEENP